jgi:hypothetical protein
MRLLAALLLAAAVAQAAGELSAADLLATIPLEGETHHVQGIVVEPSRLLITSVDVSKKRGLLMEFELPSGRRLRSIEIQEGARYHPGGMSAFNGSLWIPVAEYRRSSTSVIQKRSRRTLELAAQFAVEDHIGCVAVDREYVVGANWDAREIYFWDHAGKLLRKSDNPGSNAFQDMKLVDGKLVAGGLLQDKTGIIEWFDFPSLRPLRRLPVGRTNRHVAYTHEGMAILDGKLYLLPEDTPSRLYVFRLP